MLKPRSPQASFYGSYLYDRIVPQDHLLRRINAVVDFSFVNELVKDRYTEDFGRPAEDPELMLRLCLLQYLYYDSTQPDNTAYVGDINSTPAENVWDSDYLAVYHMADYTSGSIHDSTANHNHGEKWGVNEPQQVSGLAGQAQRFDGLDDTIWCGTGIDFNQDDFTWEILGKTGRSDREQIPLKVWSDPPVYGWLGSLEWPLDYNRNAFFGVRDDYASSIYRYLDPYNDSSDITDNEYHYLVGSLDRSLSIPPNMYQDGVLNNGYAEGNGDELGSDVGGGDTFLGSTGYYGYFQGDIDEVRISRIVRSAAWIEATDYTLRDNLVSFSSEPVGRSLGFYGEGGLRDSAAALQHVRYVWDAGGNLTQRQDLVSDETETFSYDFLDRLTSVSGAYSHSYSYDEIGNITSLNGRTYTYGSSRPHAVTSITNPGVSYTYDANGNMLTGDGRVITWDVENRPVSITKDGVTTTFVYDGDGNRVKKTVGGVTTIYVNQYYEKTGSEITTSYYLGGRQIAVRTIKDEGASLSYVHQDHLGSTSVTSDISSESTSAIKYFPYGDRLQSTGSIPTDKQFTGQRLDGTGLYYYGARYYDPTIGRFISADTIVPDPYNPQSLNRYSYCLNNPLKYTDPTGHDLTVTDSGMTNCYGETIYDVYDGDTWVGSGSDWTGVRDVYDVYCSINGLSNGCTVNYNYQSTHGTYPISLVSNGNMIGSILHNNGIRGISLNTDTFGEGIFVTWDDISKSDLNSVMKPLLEHESQHYYEQSFAGFPAWTAAYYGEIGVKWAWYGGNYWETTYNMNSFEIRARTSAGDPPYIYPVPTTHWWDPAWSKCKAALSTADQWMSQPLFR